MDSGTSDGCFSVRKQNYIEIDGRRIKDGPPERRAFCPGEFDALKEYAPELETIAKAIWTPEIIAAWEKKRVEIPQ